MTPLKHVITLCSVRITVMLILYFQSELLGAAWTREDDAECFILEQDGVGGGIVDDLIMQSEGSVYGTTRTPPLVIAKIQKLKREFAVRPLNDFSHHNVPEHVKTAHNELSQKALSCILHGAPLIEVIMVEMQSFLHIPIRSQCEMNLIEYIDHPNPHFNQTISSKCLASLLDQGKTGGGRSMIKQWVRMPSCQPSVIGDRQAIIGALMSNNSLLENIQSALRGVKNIRGLLVRLSADNNGNDLKSLVSFILSVSKLKLICGNYFEKVNQ